jgi:hypothetical protein
LYAGLSLVAALLLVALYLWWQLERGSQRWARQARRLAIRAHEAELRLIHQRRLAEVQRRTETAVELTNTAVRSLHKGIARIPFSLLKRRPETRDTAALVQRVHDATSDAVYDSISAVNRLIGSQMRRGIGLGRKPLPQNPPASESGEDENL